jgi:glycosyltransferase involved in cell wall biosynthesis
MRILHITHTDIRFDNRIIKEITSLSNCSDNKVFGVGIVRDEGSALNSLDYLNAEIINLRLFVDKLTYLPKNLQHLFKFFELFIKIIIFNKRINPDVIHCHDTLVLPIGFFIKIFFGKKLVYDAHELESNKNGQTKFLSRMTLFIEKICYNSIDLLISVSPSIINWYEHNLGKKNNVIILNSPQIKKSISSMNENIKYFHKKFNIEEDRLIFIYVGALAEGRGIEILLESFQNPLVKSHIIFMGFGPLKDNILKNSLIFNKIHFHNPVPHDDVVKIVKHADVGLCFLQNISLSDYFCLPNKLFEYIFSGTPVLATNFPDISDLISEYNLGICCDFNLSDLTNSILTFESKPPGRILRNLDHLSWNAQSEKLITAYKTLKIK